MYRLSVNNYITALERNEIHAANWTLSWFFHPYLRVHGASPDGCIGNLCIMFVPVLCFVGFMEQQPSYKYACDGNEAQLDNPV
jgi:hypothetical protein